MADDSHLQAAHHLQALHLLAVHLGEVEGVHIVARATPHHVDDGLVQVQTLAGVQSVLVCLKVAIHNLHGGLHSDLTNDGPQRMYI